MAAAPVDDPDPARRHPGALLGPLERRMLDHLWGEGAPRLVREVHGAFPALAYTTVMTTLDRLFRKGLLSRRRRGRAFAYEPRSSRADLARALVSDQVAALLSAGTASSAILSTLVQAVGSRDAALLDELEALVRAERLRLSGAGDE